MRYVTLFDLEENTSILLVPTPYRKDIFDPEVCEPVEFHRIYPDSAMSYYVSDTFRGEEFSRRDFVSYAEFLLYDSFSEEDKFAFKLGGFRALGSWEKRLE